MTLNRILGAEILTNRFGCWPSFHDANILSVERTPIGRAENVTIVAHLFRMTDEVDSKGFYVLDTHTRAAIRFRGCEDIKLNEFDHGVLFSLELSEGPSGIGSSVEVGFNSSYGIEGTFKCERIEVLSAEPSDSKGEPVSLKQSTDPLM
jgi:hypothetical protein